jgi:hypothetical protein
MSKYRALLAALEEAVLWAAESLGEEGRGPNGIKGYVKRLAKTKQSRFVSLLENLRNEQWWFQRNSRRMRAHAS